MNGILILDKPKGLTSHDVVRRIRRLFKTRRVGHAGTLDPMATGVLPVAVGEGTRVVQFLMEGEKTYRATLKLGETTDTQDAEGKVLTVSSFEGVRAESVASSFRSFEGEIQQIPPMFSALKKNGVALYKLARRGEEVSREARTVNISRLEILDIDLPFITFEVDCSKGTYVRTLCHDLGQAIGPGAHMTSLRRTRNGSFSIEESVSLDEMENGGCFERHLLSLTEALRGLPSLELEDSAARRLRHGIPPELSGVSGPVTSREGDKVALLESGELLAVARFAPSRIKEKRGDFELLRVYNGH